MFLCPVCGYDKLSRPPADFAICPSCGTEFDYDDTTKPYSQLRSEWIESGLKWFDTPAPEGWNGLEQLLRAGLKPIDNSTVTVRQMSYRTESAQQEFVFERRQDEVPK